MCTGCVFKNILCYHFVFVLIFGSSFRCCVKNQRYGEDTGVYVEMLQYVLYHPKMDEMNIILYIKIEF